MMTESRIQREKHIVEEMIRVYCRGKKHEGTLCPDCQELLDYCRRRLDHCPFGEGKRFCSKCDVHCYNPAMRRRIIEVMRYSGPRMLFHHPILAVRHRVEK